ncbi:TerC family protein [Candidatus Clostridium radicumherbarum]|uniref:TerC family protein n=1 Tax=Candidatus Clostridium radicumherbarum TaxID=3381662 RepID=A0ABW8TWB3_9CLOT
MDNIWLILFSILQITIMDITLSGDNVSVIALAIRNLPKKQAKIASLIGVAGAVVLRIIFTCIISLIMSIEWLPIKLIGGLLLIKITWDLLNMEDVSEGSEIKADKSLWKAVSNIIIADLSMGLDNVLAIAGAANGNIWLIIFGLSLSIPIIFFGAKFVANLMKKYGIIVYIGASILVYTAINMITGDNLVSKYIPDLVSEIIALVLGAAVIVYGVIKIRKERYETKNIGRKEIFHNKKDFGNKNPKETL